MLPPCSPDLNPIEMAFSRLKALLRKAAERTADGLWAAIARILETFAAPRNAETTSPPPATIQADGITLQPAFYGTTVGNEARAFVARRRS